jgi:hypothetical protein
MRGVSKRAVMAVSRRYLEIFLDRLRDNIKIPVRTVCVLALMRNHLLWNMSL